MLAHRHLDVLLYREAGEQGAVLEQHAPALFERVQSGEAERLPILRRRLRSIPRCLRHKPEDGPHQHRLALARAADKTQNFAAVDVEIEPVHDRVGAKPHHEIRAR